MINISKGFTEDEQYLLTDSIADNIANEFFEYMEYFYSYNFNEDFILLKSLYWCYLQVDEYKLPKVDKELPVFRPSGIGGCPREHYMRLSKAISDNDLKDSKTKNLIEPYKARWQRLGTKSGDYFQYDILHAEKVIEDNKFLFEKVEKETPLGETYKAPHFEQFSSTHKVIEHNGKKFVLSGSTDGIMIYTNEFGEEIRVGLEIKSKQTTSSKTSRYSMKKIDDKHLQQIIGYSILFEVDYWVVVYLNASKKSWNMTDEEYYKNPDFRVFGKYISEDMRNDVKEKLSNIVKSLHDENPLPLQLDNWNFNEYKQSCAESVTKDELEELLESRDNFIGESWKKKAVEQALDEIMDIKGLDWGWTLEDF